ncbi:hypothetical protein M0R04_00590 [Candidatus Dojkabacteria bacterium]|jgi:hypothetical protein|nr:hypothetical protein [Candidatus Dojkabacteria bacterium]
MQTPKLPPIKASPGQENNLLNEKLLSAFEIRPDLLPFKPAIEDLLRVLSDRSAVLIFQHWIGLNTKEIRKSLDMIESALIIETPNTLSKNKLLQLRVADYPDSCIFISEQTEPNVGDRAWDNSTRTLLFIEGPGNKSMHFTLETNFHGDTQFPTLMYKDPNPKEHGWLNS